MMMDEILNEFLVFCVSALVSAIVCVALEIKRRLHRRWVCSIHENPELLQ